MVPFLVFYLSLLACWILPSDAVVYVQTTGNDATGTGSQSSPVRTISRALQFNDSLIMLGPGSFDTAVTYSGNNLVLNITGSGPGLTTITNPGDNYYFRLPSTNQKMVVSDLLVGQTINGLAYVATGNQFFFINVEIARATAFQDQGIISLYGASRVTIDRCYVHDVIASNYLNPPPIIWGDSGSFITITNSKFYNNALLAATQSTFTISNSLFFRNSGILSSFGSATISITGSEFGSNWLASRPVFTCGSTATVTAFSGNVFCGSNGNRWSCPKITVTLPTNYHDGCGRCGRMDNLDKDCNGVCFGSGQNCRTPQSWYVSATANASTDGTAFWKPATLANALASAQYKDTVYVLPGTFEITTSNPLSFGGKAFTIKSYYNDPNTVIFSGETSVSNPVVTINSYESVDSVFDGVTFSRGAPNVLLTLDSGVTIKNSIVYGGYSSLQTGGIQINNDGYLILNNTQFIQNTGDYAGALYVSADNYHYSAAWLDKARFYSNILTGSANGSVHVGTYSQLTVTNSWFYQNYAGGYAADMVIDSATAWMSISSSSFSEAVVSPSNRVPSGVYCPANNALTKFTSSVLCPGLLTTWNSGCNVAGVSPAPNTTCGGCGSMAGLQDCSGMCFGYATVDVTGKNCCNNTAKDCTGICNGPGGYDINWTCCQNASNIDCFGVCNGTAKRDCKGVCNGNATIDNLTVCCYPYEITGCDKNCRSNSTFDISVPALCCGDYRKDCGGYCYGNRSKTAGGCCLAQDRDCLGTCFGDARNDTGGCCLDNERDCTGVCFGKAQNVTNGCCLDSQRDCLGVCFGTAVPDCLNICNGIAGNYSGVCCNSTDVDCFGECYGNGKSDPTKSCCLEEEMDCMGYCVVNGTEKHTKDVHGTCCTPISMDCNNTCSGTWRTDKNNTCCEPPFDCQGYCGGAEARDIFGVCCPRVTLDCAMICNGNHTKEGPFCCEKTDLDCSGKCFGSDLSCLATIYATASSGTTLGWMVAPFMAILAYVFLV